MVEYEGKVLTLADQKDLAEAIHYALLFGLTGRAHGKRTREDNQALAGHVAAHLARANYVVFRGPPTPGHTAGDDRRHGSDMP